MEKKIIFNNEMQIDSDSTILIEELPKQLTRMGYEHTAKVDMRGQFSIRGGIIDIFPLTEDNPYRIELWGDEIDSICSFDVESLRSLENLEKITIYPADKTLNWLLQSDNVAIKYRTLTEICNSSKCDEIDKLSKIIWEQKAIQRMLKKQDENGLWSEKEYGSITSLRYLTAFAEFGLQKDKRIDSFVNHSIELLANKMKDDPFDCTTPLVLRALVMLGYHSRNDVKELIDTFAETQLYDGGFICKRLLDKKPERKSCYKRSVTALLLYAECKRKNLIINNTEQIIQYFTKRDVFYTSDKTNLIVNERPGWRSIDNFFPVEPIRIGLPLIVAALSILGAGTHPALQKAWDFLNEKIDENGKLILEGTLTKQPCNFGKVGQPNKWIAFYALLAEKYKAL